MNLNNFFLEGDLWDIVNYADDIGCIHVAHWSPLTLTESQWLQQSATDPFWVPLTSTVYHWLPLSKWLPSELHLSPVTPTEPNNLHWSPLKPSNPPPTLNPIDPLSAWLTSWQVLLRPIKAPLSPTPPIDQYLALITYNDPHFAKGCHR